MTPHTLSHIRQPYQYRLMHITSGDLWAGAEVQMYNLTCALARHGCEIHTVLFNSGILEEKLRAQNIPVTVLNETKMHAARLCDSLRKILQIHQPDIIHTHGYKENILASIANKTSINSISVRTVHGDNEFNVPWWKPHRKLQHMLNRYTGSYLQQAIIAVSPALAQTLEQRHPANKIHTIENAIDIGQVLQTATAPIDTHYPKNTYKIACIGRLVPLKRQDLLISLMPQLLHKARRPVHLYLFGDGPQQQILQQQIQTLHLKNHVTLTGSITPIYPHMKQMDLIIMPSDQEGLPMTLLEAMALQIPIIAHAVGGIPRLLRQGRYGQLVTEHAPHAYLQVILETLRNPAETQNRCALAFEHLEQHYSIDVQIQAYDQLYRSLLTRCTQQK